MTTSFTSRLGTAPEEAVKAPCVTSSASNLTLNGEQTVGGKAVVAGDRVLVRSQTDATENGIYVVSTGAWSRATDWNGAGDVIDGMMVLDSYNNTLYYASFTGSFTIDATEVTFTASPLAASVAITGVQNATHINATAGGAVDVITASFSPAITAYVNGMQVHVRASGANTSTTPTINLDSVGAKTIVKNGNQALVAGDIPRADYEMLLRYNSTNDVFELLNPSLKDVLATEKGAELVGYISDAANAVARTLDSKAQGFKQVSDFMTTAEIADIRSGSPSLDVTAAVQKAITDCVDNGYDLDIDGLCRITSSLNIDRVVDGAAFDSWFKIYSSNGGGIYVDTAITMFSSSISFTTAPVTQLTKFDGLRFVASSASLAAYVLDDARFLRTAFVNCSFSKIKCLLSTIYVQSIFLLNCNARRWNGTFFKTVAQAYDVQVIGGMYEGAGGTDGFDCISPIGCKFWTQIEGLSGTALKLPDTQGVDISCYMEANAVADIDFKTGQTVPNYGINLHGSLISRSNAIYGIKWGECNGCVSHGNWHTYNMHDLDANSEVDINDFAQVNLSNFDAITHIGFRKGTVGSLTVRGANSASYTVSGQTAKYFRYAKRVDIDITLTLTSTGTNAQDQIYILSGLPYAAETSGFLCGQVEVIGSSVNNGISPVYLSSASPARVQSSIDVIPANVSTDNWTVRFLLSYLVA